MIRLKNREEYKDIFISELGFSRRVNNCLKRAEINTLYLLVKNIDSIYELRNMGEKSISEIEKFICDIKERGINGIEVEAISREERESLFEGGQGLPGTILEKPATELHVDLRIRNVFRNEGIETIGQVVNLSRAEIISMPNMGSLSAKRLQEQIDLLYEQGEEYFKWPVSEYAIHSEVMGEYTPEGKGFDFPIIDILTDRFFLKPAGMAEWFGLSRQSIYNVLEKRLPQRREIWTGKKLQDSEYEILEHLLKNRSFDYSDERVICCCLNDRQDDLACIFIYENEIKCFFLKDLPEELVERMRDSNYHRYSESELSGESDGDLVYCIRKPYFLPQNPNKFRANANRRGMTMEEYSVFMSGYPIRPPHMTNDEHVMSFLEENLVGGKVYISSDSKNQWIRSLASRNGYSIKDFIELYGYESRLDGTELTEEGARERHIEELKQYVVRDNIVYFPSYSRISKILNTYCYNKGLSMKEYIKSLGFEKTGIPPEVKSDTTEKDMQVHHIEGKFEDKVFAKYPLIGSKIIKQEVIDKLNEYSKKYIDAELRRQGNLTLHAQMQITIAVINKAKKWENQENSNFWKYITLQFGYRDTNGAVEKIIKRALESAMKKNGRLFIEDENGRAFRSTAVIHALSTRKSWMALFDFLFDFYKQNLNWKVIPDDPIISVMIHALKQKLEGDRAEDIELEISSRVFSFQEGIRKMILLRPIYTGKLFERLLSKIDAMINSQELPVNTYEEQLCEDWFKEKITEIANSRRDYRQIQENRRDVAIDYSRIRAKLVLKNENDVKILLPDIRLKKGEFSQALLSIYSGNDILYRKNISWYGNELGKTLNGAAISLSEFPKALTNIDLQVKITCDEELIYDSEDDLNRNILVFAGSSEIGLGLIKKGKYTFVLPQNAELNIENVEIVAIDDFKISGFKAYFLELKDGYVIAVDGKLIAVDSLDSSEIKVILPSESMTLPRVVTEDTEYYFAYRGGACSIILGSQELLQQYVILKNGKRIEITELPKMENSKEIAFFCPIDSVEGHCKIQIINLTNEKLIFDRGFIGVDNICGKFNREFYFSQEEYKDASYSIDIDEFSEVIFFNKEDDEVRFPYMNGEIHVAIPKVSIEETTGSWLDGSLPAWYVGNIPQNSFLKIENPHNVDISFMVGDEDIMYDGRGLASIGSVLHSMEGRDNCGLTEVIMKVKSNNHSWDYRIALVCYKEQFLKIPEFWTEGSLLYWNRGGIFIGKQDRAFDLALFGEGDRLFEFKMDENTEYVELPEEMPVGNYHYEISIISGGLFKKTKAVIAKGDCAVGEPNLLRFMNRRIVIDSITDEFNEEAGHILIRNTYIDHIEYMGMHDTSEGYCPVYKGILYGISPSGERYEFSYEARTNKRGIKKMMVNPVRFIYVGDNSLCITDSDGDGLYYYHYYDKNIGKKVYALTDCECTEANRHRYSNADLYSYRTERI